MQECEDGVHDAAFLLCPMLRDGRSVNSWHIFFSHSNTGSTLRLSENSEGGRHVSRPPPSVQKNLASGQFSVIHFVNGIAVIDHSVIMGNHDRGDSHVARALSQET